MSGKRSKRGETEDVTAFFNRGRRYAAEIVRDNEELRSKIRRLEQELRGAAGVAPGRRPSDQDSDDG